MELGATEIALAAQRLHAGPRPYIRDAARSARGYLAEETGDTLNLYDTSALAHSELLRAMDETGLETGLAVSHADLCMQHQIANLNGTTDGTPPIDVGAVVNGPNSAGIFRGGLGGFQHGMVRCPAKRGNVYRPYDGRGSRYVDDVRSWQTDEPALDMTGAAIIAAAVQLTTPHESCGCAGCIGQCRPAIR